MINFKTVVQSRQSLRLIGFTSILLIISCILLIAFTIRNTNSLQEQLAVQLLNSSVKLVQKEMVSFLSTIDENLKLSSAWFKLGLFDQDEEERIVALFTPIEENLKQVSFVSVTTGKGYELILSNEGDRFIVKKIEAAENSVVREFHYDHQGKIVEQRVYQTDSTYYYHHNLLFSGKYQFDSIFTGRVRPLYETGNLGLTRYVYLQTGEKENPVVVSFGILIDTLEEFFERQEIHENGSLVIFRADGHLLRADRQEVSSGKISMDSLLIHMDSTENSARVECIRTWIQSHYGSQEVFKFSLAGTSFYGSCFRLNPDGPREGFWVAALLPASDIAATYYSSRFVMLIGLSLILLISIMVLIIVVIRIRQQARSNPLSLENLAESDDILRLISLGESNRVEFKSSIRYNMHSGKNGKEIELAWLKGAVAFLNTEGGILLIGVQDDGSVAGLENDNFANDDKCLLHVQNLIKQHIGLEFTTFMRFTLREVSKKKILLVECLSASNPAFLKHEGKEHFYVRTGPSSVELPASKILRYIEERKTAR